MNNKLNDLTDELDDFYIKSPKNEENLSPHIWSPATLDMTTKMYQKSTIKDELPDRVYIKRNSLLTEMFKTTHIRTIRHIFTSIMVILALQVVTNDLIEKGK